MAMNLSEKYPVVPNSDDNCFYSCRCSSSSTFITNRPASHRQQKKQETSKSRSLKSSTPSPPAPIVVRHHRYYFLSRGTAVLLAAFFILIELVKYGGTIPPQLSVATSDVRVRSGDNAVLTCVVDYLGAHQLTWHRGQNVVLAVDEKLIYSDRRMSIGRPSIRTWELRIQNVTRRDAGDYYCVINSRDLPSGKISLFVEEPARIVSAPQPVVTMDEFETFKLICNASGFPRPRVEWFRLNDREEIRISENYGEILLFINVTRDCFGRYRCRASNGVGEPEHRDIEVNVIARPVVVVDPENVGRERGGKVTVDCSISGHPISWAGWFLRGELLTNGGTPPSPPPLRRSAISVSSPASLSTVKQAATSNRHRIEWLGRSSAYRAVLRLTIEPLLSDSDFGSYTCAATDGRSFTSNASFYLWEKTPMVTPGAVDASIIDSVRVNPTGDATTPIWRPSIIIDNRPTKDEDYVVASSSPHSPTFGGSTPIELQPPKIADEALPSQPVDKQPQQPPLTPSPPSVADVRQAANQKSGAAKTQDFGQQFLVTGGLLVAAAVFHLWLTSPAPLSVGGGGGAGCDSSPTSSQSPQHRLLFARHQSAHSSKKSLPSSSSSPSSLRSLGRRRRRRCLLRHRHYNYYNQQEQKVTLFQSKTPLV